MLGSRFYKYLAVEQLGRLEKKKGRAAIMQDSSVETQEKTAQEDRNRSISPSRHRSNRNLIKSTSLVGTDDLFLDSDAKRKAAEEDSALKPPPSLKTPGIGTYGRKRSRPPQNIHLV